MQTARRDGNVSMQKRKMENGCRSFSSNGTAGAGTIPQTVLFLSGVWFSEVPWDETHLGI